MSLEAEFSCQEGVSLGHGFFGAVQAVEEEFPKEGEANITCTRNAVLALGIDKQELVCAMRSGDIGVFAELDVAFSAQDQKTAITPSAQTGGREPVDTEISGRAIVAEKVAFTEVLEFRKGGIIDIADSGVANARILGTGEKKELFALVAAYVAEDTAVFLFLKKPAWSRRGIKTMWTCAKGLNNLANRSGGDQLPGAHGALDMDALAVVNGILSPRGLASAARLLELFQSGERRFIGEVVLASLHNPAPERPSFVRHGGCSNESNLGIVQDFIKRPGCTGLRKFFQKGAHPLGNGIEDPFDMGTCFDQSIALSIDVSVIEVRGGHCEFARFANRGRFSHRGMRHSIRRAHNFRIRRWFQPNNGKTVRASPQGRQVWCPARR